MRFRCLCNPFALLLSVSLLAVTATQTRSTYAQELLPHSFSPQATPHRNWPPHPTRTPRVRSTAATQITPGASSTTPNFGGFYAAPLLSNGDSSAVTISGDFNNDGKPDIGLVDFGGAVYTWLNNGHGFSGSPTMAAPVILYNAVQGEGINWATTADFNGDGYADIVLGIYSSQFDTSNWFLAVLMNQKNGTFGAAQTLVLPTFGTYGTRLQDPACTTEQTTKGAHVDIVCAGLFSGSIITQTFLNNGSGTFTALSPQTISTPADEPAQYNPIRLAFADVDRDGIQDLLISKLNYPTTYVDILLGKGDGTFQQPLAASTVALPVTGLGSPTLITGPLTNDSSKADLIFSDSYTTSVALANGNGTFQPPTPLVQAAYASEIHLADLNKDGKLDLIISGSGNLITFLGQGDGAFGPAAGTGLASGGLSGFETNYQTVIADFNSDGKLDFANANSYGYLEVALGKGDGSFVSTPLITSSTSLLNDAAAFSPAATPDLNGDGVADLVGYGDNTVLSGLSTGKGTFAFQKAFSTATSYGQYIEPVTADFNADGKQDLILVGEDGTATVALSKGDGTLTVSSASIQPLPKLSCALGTAAVGDLNGDGKQDLVFAYKGDSVCGGSTTPSGYFVALGNGNGTFKTPVFQPIGISLVALALDHFHGANKPLDLVVSDYGYNGTQTPPSVSILQGKGDGTFSDPVTVRSGNFLAISDIHTDDFNKDGKADLTLVSGYGFSPKEGIALYSGNGDGTFTEGTVLGPEFTSFYASYADLNGDGIPDLIANTMVGLLSVYLGTGQGNFAEPINYYYQADGAQLFSGRFLADNTFGIIGGSGVHGGTAFFMNQGGTSLTLTPSATSVMTGTAVSLTAKLTATLSDQPTPTGTITYYDGTTKLGAEPVGTELAGVKLAAGTHKLTASYPGDTHFNPNTSTAVTVTSVTAATPSLTLSPATLAFGSVKVGTASATQIVTVKNNTSAAVPLTSITIPAPFVKTASNCGPSVPNGAACTVTLAYRPTATGASSGTLVVSSPGAGSPFSVALTGTGIAATALTLSPTTLAFGSVKVGTTSATQIVTVKNNTSAAVPLTSITIPAPFVKTASNCGPSVPNGAACTVTLAYRPTATGASSGTLVVSSPGAGSPFSVALTGTGIAATALTLSPTTLAFGSVKVGTTSATQIVTVKNNTSAAVPLTSITIPAPFVKTASNCGPSVPNGAACTVTLAYRPTATGASSGTLVVSSPGAGSPFSVALTGTGD